MKKGINLSGGDIKNIIFTTIAKCKDECKKSDGCVAFVTKAGTDNKCYLKSKDHGEESSDSISISSRLACYVGELSMHFNYRLFDKRRSYYSCPSR